MKKSKKIFSLLAIIDFSVILIILSLGIYYYNRIIPRLKILDTEIGGLKESEAKSLILSKKFPTTELTLVSDEGNFKIPLDKIDFSIDYSASVNEAFKLGRSANILLDLQQILESSSGKINMRLKVRFDEEKLFSYLYIISGQLSIDSVDPTFKIVKGQIVVNKGKPGREIDLQKLRNLINENLGLLNANEIAIPIKTSDITLSDSQEKTLKERLKKFIGKNLMLTFEDKKFNLKDDELISFVNYNNDYDLNKIKRTLNEISTQLDRKPQNPVFIFLPEEEGVHGRVSEFLPSKEGVKVKEEELKTLILSALSRMEKGDEKNLSYNIPVVLTPAASKTENINNLGIKELIGKGTSKFRGSIPSRVDNIVLATSRINGALISPGEVFSFNETLGDVSKFTGYKEAYIIKDNKTILGDGGGVCQVSSTLFRAALSAGLSIIERRAHAYRVGYYEQDSLPGFDATVYSPTTDLKFKNDTGAHILIQAKADTKNLTLTFELYGTKDGRMATTTKPIISDRIAPPEDVYIDDPTLASGKIKQIDYKAEGAKVTFDYTVKKEGQVIYQKTFISNYRPWQAVYLRGVGSPQ